MSSPKRISPARYAEALEKSGGWVSKAAEALGVSQSAVSQAIQRHPEVAEARENAKGKYLDLAENKLLGLINDSNLGAICFFLKCQGKQRGWVERQEVTGADGEPVKYIFTWGEGEGS